MTAEAAGIAVSGVLALAALVVSIKARGDAKEAAKQAKRSADAAESADKRDTRAEQRELADRAVYWVVEREPGKARYFLANVGKDTAENIQVSPGSALSGPDAIQVSSMSGLHSVAGGRRAEIVMLVRTEDAWLDLTWAQPDGSPGAQRVLVEGTF